MEIKGELWEAAEDLRFLLDRGYPRDASLQLVGNRYNLDQEHRHLLRRGVFPHAVVAERRKKQVSAKDLTGKGLVIDGHNCLITLESALKGKTILLADDGFIRDISGVSGTYKKTAETHEALRLIMNLLAKAGPSEIRLLLDAPISGSGELASRIRGLMHERGIQGDAVAVKVPERIMAGYEGICASSDTAVIDDAEHVFDLAGHLIIECLKTTYIDIKKMHTSKRSSA
ncbi:MAG: DUF434 domain-containing protein [Deltaproteobacteria bacterium]|nr:DUF434 domain-containing protein [Deltaproteobacteria bacterium]